MSSHVMLKFNRLLRFKLLEKKIVQEIYKILYLRIENFISNFLFEKTIWFQVHNRMPECYRNWWESCFQNLEKLKA